MAEGGDDSFNVVGSEPVFDFYCEFCNEKGLHREAAGHCLECDEYLCDKCISNHEGNRYTQHHEVLDKENMPKDTPPSSNRTRKDITTKCKQHKDKLLKYYCKTHDILGCSSCIITGHKTCTDTVNITETSETIFDDTEYKDFIQKLNSLETKIHNINTQSRDHVTKSQRCCSEAIEAVKQFRDEINSIIDDIENKLKQRAADIKTGDITKMETLEHTCITAKETLDKIASEFKSLQSADRVCQAYIRMKETAIDVEEIERQLTEAENKNTISIYTFVPNNKLTEFLTGPDVLGLLSMEEYTETKDQDASPVSSVSFVQNINVKSTKDGYTCWITGSTILSNSRLVIVDNNNKKVKLVDTKNLNMISELQVSGEPCDVTVIKDDLVAVTIPGEQAILVLEVTDSITQEREICVGGECYGIVYNNNQLIVSYKNPEKVEIMDLQGNVISTIDTDKDGNKLFDFPQYICASDDGDTIYVSDYKYNGGKVISMSRNGSIKAIYTDSDLKGPRKLSIDHRGNVFVCCYDSQNIHMINVDCTKINEILTRTDGLKKGVYSASHCRQTDRLFVGMSNHYNIKVYQLS